MFRDIENEINLDENADILKGLGEKKKSNKEPS